MITKNKKGFTLIELLIAVAIMALLLAIVLPSFSNSRKKSRDLIRKGDLKSLEQASELYYAEHNYTFPSNLSDLSSYFTDGVLPKDPLTKADYLYSMTPNPKSFCIGATLEVGESETPCTLAPSTYTVKGP